ncbi:ARM repeat-containing protein, partial [Auriscalpium vulgare]
MSYWSPQEECLKEVLLTIHESTLTQQQSQRNITHKLNTLSLAPDYIAYLAYILSCDEADDSIRRIAGYLLKNSANTVIRVSPEAVDFIKASLLQAFSDPCESISNVAGLAIVAFLGILEPRGWPECLLQLIDQLGGTDDQQQLAFFVLEKACEDYPGKLNVEIHGGFMLDYVVPTFLLRTEHQNSRIRSHAVACLSNLVPTKPHTVPISAVALLKHIDLFIACLLKCAWDEDPTVRRRVCQALLRLLAWQPDRLIPQLDNIAGDMLFLMKDTQNVVVLEACEFWLTFAEAQELAAYLLPLLPQVAPRLLDCMVYSKEDLLWLDADVEEDAAVPDKDMNIKPRHYSGKTHGLNREGTSEGEGSGNGELMTKKVGAYGKEQLNEVEDVLDDDESDGEDSANEMEGEWNSRSCAAAALEELAVRFGSELYKALQEALTWKLWDAEWTQRESATLALGAVAGGCSKALEPDLPKLVPYLVNALNDPKPLVRSISCWTLGRYASHGWCTQPMSDGLKQIFLIPTMEGLLRMVLDNNKRVQEAGCSAFATLEEDAGAELAPYIEPVLRSLVLAFHKYQAKNMQNLYDAVGMLANAVRGGLQEPKYVDTLLPLLLGKMKVKDHDKHLIPLLECLASVTTAVGKAMCPYSEPVFDRCVNIARASMAQYQTYQQNPDLDEPDKMLLVFALDLLSGLTHGVGMQLKLAMENSQPEFFQLIMLCLKHPQAPVRQSAYALVGDLAMSCFPMLRPHMPEIMQELILQLDPEPKMEFISACNNAAWSVGEVALRYGRDDPEFRPWVQHLISRLVPILLHPKAPRSLHENAAVSIGRIGLMHPSLVAPLLPEFAQAWCQALYEIRDNEEKDSAFRGLCTLVQANPMGITKSLLWFCNVIVRWNTPSSELNSMFETILTGFKAHD